MHVCEENLSSYNNNNNNSGRGGKNNNKGKDGEGEQPADSTKSKEKVNYGKVTMGVVRTTNLIDENGVIEKAFGSVKAAENPAQMLAALA